MMRNFGIIGRFGKLSFMARVEIQTLTIPATHGKRRLALRIVGDSALSTEFTFDSLTNAAGIRSGFKSRLEALFPGKTVTVTGTVSKSGDDWSGPLTLTWAEDEDKALVELVSGEERRVVGSSTVSYNSVSIVPGDTASEIQADVRGSGNGTGDSTVNVDGTSTAATAPVKPSGTATINGNAINTGLDTLLIFNEGAGTTYADISGNGNDANSSNSAWVSGTYGPALRFSNQVNSGKGIDLANDFSPGASDFSIQMIVRTGATVVDGAICQNYGSGQGVFGIGIGSGYLRAFVRDDAGVSIYSPASTLAAINTTYLVTMVKTGTTVKMYVDAALAASNSDAALGTITASGNGSFGIGYLGIGGGNEFTGDIEMFRLWTRAISGAEVSSLAANPLLGIEGATGTPGALDVNLRYAPSFGNISNPSSSGGTVTTEIQGGTVLATSVATQEGIAPAPEITSIAPAKAPPGHVVTITGTNLSGVTSVDFSGRPARQFEIVSDTEIKAVVPAK